MSDKSDEPLTGIYLTESIASPTSDRLSDLVQIAKICKVPTEPRRPHGRTRCGKDTGLNRFPSKHFAINAVWLTCALTAIDLIAWTQTILLHDDPALSKGEPKTLRYRLLHVAARLTRGSRRLRLKIDRTWRWASILAAAFSRLRALPTPQT